MAIQASLPASFCGVRIPPVLGCYSTMIRSPPPPLSFDQIRHFEVTWLGLHAFREVFGAFSTKHRGFTRPKLDMHRALLEAEGGRGLEGRGRTGSRKCFVEEISGGSGGGTTDTRRGRGCDRLRRVVRAPDALNLLRTLTDVR